MCKHLGVEARSARCFLEGSRLVEMEAMISGSISRASEGRTRNKGRTSRPGPTGERK